MIEDKYWIVTENDFNKRYALCLECKEYNKDYDVCTICSCEMKSKATTIYAECPIGKWGRLDGNIKTSN